MGRSDLPPAGAPAGRSRPDGPGAARTRHHWPVPRLFVTREQLRDGTLAIDGEPGRHLAASLRTRPGDLIVVVDDAGREHGVRVAAVQPGRVTGTIVWSRAAAGEPLLHLEVVHALIREMDEVVAALAEMGAAVIHPIVAQRSVSRPDPERAAARTRRWAEIARKAAELAHRARVPAVRTRQRPGERAGGAAGGLAYPRLHGGRADASGPSGRRPGPAGGAGDRSGGRADLRPRRSGSATRAPSWCTSAPGCFRRAAPRCSRPACSSAAPGTSTPPSRRHRHRDRQHPPVRPTVRTVHRTRRRRGSAPGGAHHPRLQGQLRGDGRPRRDAGGPRLRGGPRGRARRRARPQLLRGDPPGGRHHPPAAAAVAPPGPRLPPHPHRLLGGRQPRAVPGAPERTAGRRVPHLDAVFANAEKSRIADHVVALAARVGATPRRLPRRGCAAAPSSRSRMAATTAAPTAWCGGRGERRPAYPPRWCCPGRARPWRPGTPSWCSPASIWAATGVTAGPTWPPW